MKITTRPELKPLPPPETYILELSPLEVHDLRVLAHAALSDFDWKVALNKAGAANTYGRDRLLRALRDLPICPL